MILLQLFRSCAHRPSMMQPLLSICTLLSARCRETTPLLTGETALPGWAEIDSARAWSIASSASSVMVFPVIFSTSLMQQPPCELYRSGAGAGCPGRVRRDRVYVLMPAGPRRPSSATELQRFAGHGSLRPIG